MLDTTELTAGLLPSERLRYFMASGIEGPCRGHCPRHRHIRLCVYPPARPGWERPSRSKASSIYATRNMLRPQRRWRRLPLHACRGFSRGANRHFVMQKEILGLMLLTEHNLTFLMRLVPQRGPLSSPEPSRRSEARGAPRVRCRIVCNHSASAWSSGGGSAKEESCPAQPGCSSSMSSPSSPSSTSWPPASAEAA